MFPATRLNEIVRMFYIEDAQRMLLLDYAKTRRLTEYYITKHFVTEFTSRSMWSSFYISTYFTNHDISQQHT